MDSVANLNLNDHHQSLINNYLQFARYQRHQYLKSIQATFQDILDSRLLEETYTKYEVAELINNTSDLVFGELETELINFCHTNVLLLNQMFRQAEKWHLQLNADFSEVQNKDLLDGVQIIEKETFKIDKVKLLPLQSDNDKSLQLLQCEIQKLEQQNVVLNKDITELQNKVLDIRQENEELSASCENKDKKISELIKIIDTKHNIEPPEAPNMESEMIQTEKILEDYEIVLKEQISAELEQMRTEVVAVQSQLTLAEMELEKKFNNTAAYNNMKKIISKKNDQIKDLRKQLMKYEPISDENIDGIQI